MATVSETLSNALRPVNKSRRERLNLKETRAFTERIFGEDLHALRVLSLANGVAGLLHAAVLSIHAIGQAYASVACIKPKSGVKQVDRLLSNGGLVLETVLERWVKSTVGEAQSIVIALDWTDFERDDQVTLWAAMTTGHGRATPLAWETMPKSELKDRQTDFEFEFIDRLFFWIPQGVKVTLLADRGFGSRRLYDYLQKLGWNFVIRFRESVLVEDESGEIRAAADWVSSNGHAKLLRDVRITKQRIELPGVVVVKRKKMKQSWCLATNMTEAKASEVANLYAKRFTIEETFRDTKDLNFGMGLSATHIRDCTRRDRLLLLVAMAHTLLTLLGAASEASGLDSYLKVNTVKRRTHSLFRQGLYWYHAIPNMRDDWLERLIGEFDRIVREHAFFGLLFEEK